MFPDGWTVATEVSSVRLKLLSTNEFYRNFIFVVWG